MGMKQLSPAGIATTAGCGTPPASGGSGGPTEMQVAETEIDFGTRAVRSKTFTVTDAQVTPQTKIVVTQSAAAATGRDADEAELDSIHYRAVSGQGQFTLHATVVEGYAVSGLHRINYIRGG